MILQNIVSFVIPMAINVIAIAVEKSNMLTMRGLPLRSLLKEFQL